MNSCYIFQIGDTPIHKASVNGHKSVVQLLLKAGADPSVANEVNSIKFNCCTSVENTCLWLIHTTVC